MPAPKRLWILLAFAGIYVMEDVADNFLHPDPYYRQGGDMVRVGGLRYTIDPAQPMGRRIRDARVGGRPLEPNRRYRATGWASLGEAAGVAQGTSPTAPSA